MWRFIAVALLVTCGLNTFADEPNPAEKKPQYERLLQGDDAKKAAELEGRIVKAEDADHYDEVIKLSEELLTLRTEVQGADHWETVNAKWRLHRCRALAALSVEKRASWRSAFLKSIEANRRLQATGAELNVEPFVQLRRICEQILGEKHPETAFCYHGLANVLRAHGKYSEAENMAKKALDIHLELLGEMHPDTAVSCDELASILDTRGNYADAHPLHAKALEAFRTLFGESHARTLTCYNNTAYNLSRQSRFAEAQSLLENCLVGFRQLFGEKHRNTASGYNNLAGIMDDQGKHAEALPLHRKALELRRELFGELHFETAQSYGNVAANLKSQQKYTDAQPFAQNALEINREVLGDMHPSTATSYNNLADILTNQGKFAEALPLNQKSLSLYLELYGEKHRETANSIGNLADNLLQQGKYAEAQLLSQRSLDLSVELFGEKHVDTAPSYNGLALSLRAQQRYAEAHAYFQKAHDINQELRGDAHRYTQSSLRNLALNLQDQGKYAEAQPLLALALDRCRKLFGERDPSTLLSEVCFASNLMGREEYTQAQSHYQNVLELERQIFGDVHHKVGASYKGLSENLMAQGQYAAARPLLVDGAACYEVARFTTAGRGIERAVIGGNTSPYPFLAATHCHLLSPLDAWVAAESDLARGMTDEIVARRGVTLTADDQSRRTTLTSRLSQLHTRILQLMTKQLPTNAEQDELDRLQVERRLLDSQLSELTVNISRRELVELTQVQAVMPGDSALLLWIDLAGFSGTVQEHWGCVLLPSGEPIWKRLPGTGKSNQWTGEEITLTQRFRKALASNEVPDAELSALATRVFDQRLAPLVEHLSGVKTLYVVPVNAMAGIPVDVLTRDYVVSYVPSGTFLARLREMPLPAVRGLMALADPIFDGADSKPIATTDLPPGGLFITQVAAGSAAAKAGLQARDVLIRYGQTELTSHAKLPVAIQTHLAEKEVSIVVWREGAVKPFTKLIAPGKLGVVLHPELALQAIATRRKADEMLLTLRGGDWRELPGTRIELAQVARLFGTDARTLLDSAASEQSLEELRKSGELSKYRYLHFATHGEANSVRAFESTLIMSQDRLPKDPLPRSGEPFINGQLSASEVLEYWKLDAELVTLSACETAIGRDGGGDGLLGFAQAFLTAGSRAVCLSLWKVDDTATALLMTRFYQNLVGKRPGLDAPMPKAAALHEAKRWLRELSAEEASNLTAAANKGVLRADRGKQKVNVVDPLKEVAAKDSKPYAHPRYWSAFILIGDPN